MEKHHVPCLIYGPQRFSIGELPVYQRPSPEAWHIGVSEMRRDTSRSEAKEEKLPSLFPAFITSQNGAKRDKPRDQRPRYLPVDWKGEEKNNRQTFPPTNTVYRLQSKCQHNEMSPAPSALPSVMTQSLRSREGVHQHRNDLGAKQAVDLQPSAKNFFALGRRIRITKSEAVRVRAFAKRERQRAWTM